MSSQHQPKRRPSLRDRLRPKGENSASRKGESAQAEPAVKRAAYVPMHAASSFARTAGVPIKAQWQNPLTVMKEQEEEDKTSNASSDTFVHTHSIHAPRLSGVGHLYIDPVSSSLHPEEEFAEFIRAAEADERTRRALVAEKRSSLATVSSGGRRRDSGYYSMGQDSGNGVRVKLTSAPKKQKAEEPLLPKSFGQRLSSYIKPARPISALEAEARM